MDVRQRKVIFRAKASSLFSLSGRLAPTTWELAPAPSIALGPTTPQCLPLTLLVHWVCVSQLADAFHLRFAVHTEYVAEGTEILTRVTIGTDRKFEILCAALSPIVCGYSQKLFSLGCRLRRLPRYFKPPRRDRMSEYSKYWLSVASSTRRPV